MRNDPKSAIEHAFRVILRPVASMALKCGMTWKEFSDLSKSAFVQAASEDYGIDGRPTNISRVSILTGISRKESKRQRDLLSNKSTVKQGKTTDATRVLSGWHQDPLYLDEDSNPKILPETGASPSMETLCRRYGGDIPVQTMLKELLITKSVERTPAGHLKVISRFYQPAVHDDETLRWAANLLKDLAETAQHDVFIDESTAPRFCRKTDSDHIMTSAIPEFRNFLGQRGQAFMEEIDDWLAKHEASTDSQTVERARIGIGLFAIEDRN